MKCESIKMGVQAADADRGYREAYVYDMETSVCEGEGEGERESVTGGIRKKRGRQA